MKSITTLVADIYSRITSGELFPEAEVEMFGKNLAKKLANRLSEERGKPTLRLSNLGSKCDRKLWYSIRRSELAEPLSGPTRLKFLIGDILEELVFFLARAAGHTVEREQEEVDLHGVKGHIDGVIDGELVDSKSASPYGFRKFADHTLTDQTDDFGYLTQLDGYLASLPVGDNLNPERAHFLAIDKTLGHLALDTHEARGTDYAALVEKKRAILAKDTPPPRGYTDQKEGESGNRKLGVACSYCAFKRTCWPGVRTFAYSKGPTFLTYVAKEPKVDEIKW